MLFSVGKSRCLVQMEQELLGSTEKNILKSSKKLNILDKYLSIYGNICILI